MWSFVIYKFYKKRVSMSLPFTCVTNKVEADELNHTIMDIDIINIDKVHAPVYYRPILLPEIKRQYIVKSAFIQKYNGK